VHKNRQITVDFMSNILLDQGMDARQMKKHIQLAALENFRSLIEFGDDIDLALILDLPTRNITKATLNRLDRVLDKMIEDAEAKL
jgi:hypothetical protein